MMLGLIKALSMAKTDEERWEIIADSCPPTDPSLFPKGPKTLTIEGHVIELAWEWGGVPCYDVYPDTLHLTKQGWVKPTTGRVMMEPVLDTQPDELFLQQAAEIYKTHFGCYPAFIRLFHHKYGVGWGKAGGGADKWGALMEGGD